MATKPNLSKREIALSKNGRGFALVADEVRKLAKNTKIATLHINASIGKFKAIHEAFQHLSAKTETSLAIQAQIIDCFNTVKQCGVEVWRLLDLIQIEKRQFESADSSAEGEAELF